MAPGKLVAHSLPAPILPFLLLLLLLLPVPAALAAEPGTQPVQFPAAQPVRFLSIVIDDVGNDPREGRRAIALPGAVAIAVLPHTPFGVALAEEAHRAGKEVLLHLPMDPNTGPGVEIEPGPGRIEVDMPALEIAATLRYDLETVPHAVGVNNHMGSLVTQSSAAMNALMDALRRRGGLFFLDSRTSPRSVAAASAAKHGLATLERDVFLDNERTPAAVQLSLERIEHLLATRDHAIAIGHPYPETLAALERWLPTLAARNIRLVSLTTMLQQQRERKSASPGTNTGGQKTPE